VTWAALSRGMVVVPSGAGLMSAPPSRPGVAEVAGGAIGRLGRQPERSAGFGDADLRPHLAAYKRPRSVRFVPDLPKTPTGKVMRREPKTLDS
jgi:acyl-CoA synthetase (AMP-forming)/AMP-acid ligase II